VKQCDATTLVSTYSSAHRCLKKSGIQKVGARFLCAHHRKHGAPKGASR
jgi:hypothetical protein